MIDESQFIAEISSDPFAVEPRLVYADWLDENGDERGRYLRAELEFADADPTSELAARKFRQLAAGLFDKRSSITKSWVQQVGVRFEYWLLRLKYSDRSHFSEFMNASLIELIAKTSGSSHQGAQQLFYSSLPQLVTSNVPINNLIKLPNQFGSQDDAARPDPHPVFLIRKHDPSSNPSSNVPEVASPVKPATSFWRGLVRRIRRD